MSFDSYIDDFGASGEEPKKVKATPENVAQTISFGTSKVNYDYLPQVQSIPELKEYVADMKHLNLYKHGWRFQFGTSKQWAGLCDAGTSDIGKSDNRNIYVSIDFVKHERNWEANMSHTIHHEIAHAIVQEIFYFRGKSHILMAIDPANALTQGHGKMWGLVCDKIFGGKCEMYYKNADFKIEASKFKYVCFNCGHKEYGSYKNFATYCPKCDTMIIVEPNIE